MVLIQWEIRDRLDVDAPGLLTRSNGRFVRIGHLHDSPTMCMGRQFCARVETVRRRAGWRRGTLGDHSSARARRSNCLTDNFGQWWPSTVLASYFGRIGPNGELWPWPTCRSDAAAIPTNTLAPSLFAGGRNMGLSRAHNTPQPARLTDAAGYEEAEAREYSVSAKAHASKSGVLGHPHVSSDPGTRIVVYRVADLEEILAAAPGARHPSRTSELPDKETTPARRLQKGA